MTDRLRECPFCGGEARITKLPKSVKPKAYHIGCSQCGTVKILFMTEEEAIENWNTRKPMDKIIEELEEASYWSNEIYDDWGDVMSESMQIIDLPNAIEIVKAGGKNE